MDGLQNKKPVLNVEVLLNIRCALRPNEALNLVQKYFNEFTTFCSLEIKVFDNTILKDAVESITFCNVELTDVNKANINLANFDIKYHIYQLNLHSASCDDFSNADGVLQSSCQWVLPSTDFHDRKVNRNLINLNRVVLLHGPPGSGKTSLCRALAQKLSIRLSDRYRFGQLIEVNSHSLFSKWFSESGKLVMQMFNSVREIISDDSCFIILLIDEVESLSRSRSSALSGTEPSDAIRAVNALLTQIDSISRYPNALILTTSNLSGAIDLAFVDRADLKQYIGLPGAAAIYQIFTSCIDELMRVEIISPKETLLNYQSLEIVGFFVNIETQHSVQLYKIAELSVGLSGRTLRKLPLIAHSTYIQNAVVSLDVYLNALMKTVERQFDDLQKMIE
ncbi:Pachytene checkpoint protein 2 [Chamberlinius hualienensis]